jgi:hypothetical protein
LAAERSFFSRVIQTRSSCVMKKAVIAAVAASTLLGPTFTAQALAQPRGHAYGQQPRVCLLTFSSTTGNTGADADVVKAQYLPLAIAQKLEARNDSLSDIYTYGATGYQGTGVDYYVMSPNDPALGITPDMNTQQVCSALEAYAEQQATNDDDNETDD